MPWMVHVAAVGSSVPTVKFDRDPSPLAGYSFPVGSDMPVAMGGLSCGLPAPRELVPTAARLSGAARWRPQHFLQLKSFLAVSSVVKTEIERIEPNVHEFFPITLTKSDGQPIDLEWSYFLLNICNRTDAIDASRSVLRYVEETKCFHVSGVGSGVEPKLVFKKSATKGMCLWRDARISRNFFVSDEFMKFIKKIGKSKLYTSHVYSE